MREADNMSQEISKTISAWHGSKTIDMGKKTAANLETMCIDILEKLSDI